LCFKNEKKKKNTQFSLYCYIVPVVYAVPQPCVNTPTNRASLMVHMIDGCVIRRL